MWLHGIPGSGKTVLCSSIIEHLSELCRPQNESIVISFFFEFSTKDKSSLSKFLRTLLSQLVVQKQSTLESIHTLYAQHHDGFKPPSERVLLETLRVALVDAGTVYFVMDALDESCERVGLLNIVEQVATWQLNGLHLLATSRSESDIEDTFRRLNSTILHIGGQNIKQDIKIHVQNSVSQDRRLGRWASDVQREVVEAVSHKAGEMFRWATCQLEALRKCRNVKELYKALETLPDTLDETYARILDTLDPVLESDALKILSWLCFAFEAPTVAEFVDILAVDVDSLTYDPAQRVQDLDDILSICGSLVTKSSGSDGVLKLAHSSVKEYLMSDRILKGRHSKYYIDQPAADKLIATTCLVYLRYQHTRNGDYPREGILQPLIRYSLNFWPEHFIEADAMSDLLPLAVDLLTNSESSFLEWAWLSGYSANGLYTEAPHNNTGTNLDALLYYAALVGSPDLMKAFLARGADINTVSGQHGTPLTVATLSFHISSVEYLLSEGANINASGSYTGNPLEAAASCGWLEAAKLLISKGANVNAYENDYDTALIGASMTALQLVIDRYGVDYTTADAQGRTVLHMAAQGITVGTIEYLIKLGLNPNQEDIRGWSPLHYAALTEDEENLKALLPHTT
ncbi:ankyrin, partial [Amniculicola lignicola CBS 123094]